MLGKKKENFPHGFFLTTYLTIKNRKEVDEIIITLNINNCKRFYKKSFDLNKKPMEVVIESYNQYIDCNDFSNLMCPNCKKTNCLTFYKRYPRNLTYMCNGEKIDIIIFIAVCICNNCKHHKGSQKYHAILPDFILPYHIYESSTIINALYRSMKGEKILEILKCLKITHKLFYDWLRKLKKYILHSSVIIKVNNNYKLILEQIYKLNCKFLNKFYSDYYHPFFLFKKTCVPLCITP